MARFRSFLAVIAVCAGSLYTVNGAQAVGEPTLVKDINTASEGSFPSELTEIGGTLYFAATHALKGRELWKLTQSGPVMVKDIAPAGSSSPEHLTVMGGKLYFTADDGVKGRELWKSDGTAAGTVMVKDIRPGSDGAFPRLQRSFLDPLEPTGDLTAVGGTLYFDAQDATHGMELWKSNGTAAGTRLVKDIRPGPSSGLFLPEFAAIGNTVFFRALTEQSDGLWRSNGTTTTAVANSPPAPDQLTVVGSELLFVASPDPGSVDPVLWKATVSSPAEIVEGAGDVPQHLTSIAGKLYFFSDDDNHLSTYRPGENVSVLMSSGDASGFTKVGSTVYFANGCCIGEAGLWKTNGTPGGTVLVKAFADMGELEAVGTTLLFAAGEDPAGQLAQLELWRSRGTAGTTALVDDIVPGPEGSRPSDLLSVGGTLYFAADDPAKANELRRSSAPFTTSVLVKDIHLGTKGASISRLVAAGGKLFFAASDRSHGSEPWVSTGTAAGTKLLKDVLPGSVGGLPFNNEPFGTLGGSIYFAATNSATGTELWKSDGTPAGTSLVKNITPGSGGSFPALFTTVGNTLYFRAFDPVNGAELWKSNGTPAGTQRVSDISGPGMVYEQPTSIGNTVYFVADDGQHGAELWKSNGTEAGTQMVKDLRDPGGATPRELTTVGPVLYFYAAGDDGESGLWKSNGAPAGTVFLKGLFGLPPVATSNGMIFFAAADSSGMELWKSNGTPAGTSLVKNIAPGAASSWPLTITAIGNTVYFTAEQAGTGRELWKSNGTAAGTSLLKQIAPGAESAFGVAEHPPGFFNASYDMDNVGGKLFFGADDGQHGQEPWTSNGTAAGTKLVADLYPGPEGSAPSEFTGFGPKVAFKANHGLHGFELWVAQA